MMMATSSQILSQSVINSMITMSMWLVTFLKKEKPMKVMATSKGSSLQAQPTPSPWTQLMETKFAN